MKVDIASLTGEKHAMHVQLLPKYLQKDADGHTRLSANLVIIFCKVELLTVSIFASLQLPLVTRFF